MLAVLAATGLVSCKNKAIQATAPEGYPYQITTTVGMITDITRNVVGEPSLANVEGIIGQGIDPHLYKPTRNDLVALTDADVIFYNGLKLEGKMEDALVTFAKKGKPVHAVTEAIQNDASYLLTGDDSHLDPHVWMDVQGWIKATEAIAKSLASYDPQNAEKYTANSASYLTELRKLDDYARQVIATIPEGQRVLVTAHDAFGYLGKAYGIEVRGIQGLSTESEAGVKDIENLVDFLVERNIPVVFVESSVSSKNVSALVEGTRARGHDLQIGGTLYSDAMGADGTYEGTYIGMIDHNVTTIARALGGTAPATGLNGQLALAK